jgi:hypothetical protein
MKEKYRLKQRDFKRYGFGRRNSNLNGVSKTFGGGVRTMQKVLFMLFLGVIFLSTASAHRGAKNEVDTCRFSVGDEVIHFSAYTPTATGGTSYCHFIPNVDTTHLVFDYEGKKLRNTTVEFEITKEPEGTRIFHQKPEKIKKGSVDAVVDFKQFGAGEYLSHVTIMYKGEKLDSHLPFSVGVAEEKGGLPYKILIPILLMIISFFAVPLVIKAKQKK